MPASRVALYATQGAHRLGHRARPKIDRIACPWLIRRFIDPNAVFLFVAPPEVAAVGERLQRGSFNIEDVFWVIAANSARSM